MLIKKKYLLLTFILIIIFQALIYTNNNQSTSFRYLKWTLREVSIGKLISISFFSGLFISSLLNRANISYEKNNIENINESYEPLNDEIDKKSNVEIPPQRDIREAQPTISVNYRVIKNTEGDNLESEQYYSNKTTKNDDWDNSENDW